MRAERRETFREAVFLCTMPFWAARISSGSAARRAATASFWLPEAIASSTLRMNVRTRLRRERLIAVRLAILRVIFLAETVLAMAKVLVGKHRCDEPCGSYLSPGGDRRIAMETEEPADRAGSCEAAYRLGSGKRQQQPALRIKKAMPP